MGLVFICRLAGDANHSTQSLLGGRGGCKEIARLPQRRQTPPMRTPVHLVDERPLIGRATIGFSASSPWAGGDEDAIQTVGNEDSVGLRL
jgi:hypothetical protein